MRKILIGVASAMLVAGVGCSGNSSSSSSGSTGGTTGRSTTTGGTTSATTTGGSSSTTTTGGTASGSSSGSTGGSGSGSSSGSGSGSSGSTGVATGSGSGSGSGSTGGVIPGSTVVIRAVDTYYAVTDAGSDATYTEDLSTAPTDGSQFSVLVAQGDGGYVELTGAPSADGGEFDIPGAPDAGPVLVHDYSQYDELTGRDIDYGWQYPGRIDVTYFSSLNNPTPTDVKLGISGLAPLQNQDTVELFAPNQSGFAAYALQQDLVTDAGAPAFEDGGSSLSGHIDWGKEMSSNGYWPEAVDGSQDPIFAVELNADSQAVGTLKSWTATHFVDLSGLTVTEGVATSQNGTAILITGQQPYTVTASRPSALEAAMPTGSTFTGFNYDLFVSPSPEALGVPYFGWADLSYGNDTATTLVATPSVADPFPTFWPVGGWLSINYDLPVEASASPAVTYHAVEGFAVNQAIANRTLAYTPAIGPVGTLKVDGQSADTNVNASATPTLSWAAPAQGTPTEYDLQAIQLTVDTTNSTVTHKSRAYVRLQPGTTQFTFPASLLPTGSYVFLVNAVVSDADLTKPNYQPTHSEYSTVATHLVTVP